MQATTNIDITTAEAELPDTLNTDQRAAVLAALQSNIVIVTGGPGRGKTYTARTIISILKDQGLRVALCAPTGKAAKRLAELTGYPATTIHRLLEPGIVENKDLGGDDGSDAARDEDTALDTPSVGAAGAKGTHRFAFKRDASNPLDYHAVVVDEASMIDVPLMAALCAALPDPCRLILIGDVDQLPSVGPGNVLRDLIESKRVPVARLSEVVRQKADSYIIHAANNVNAGRLPLGNDALDKSRDFIWLPEATERGIISQTLRIACENDALVIVPMHRPSVGTKNLNKLMQQRMNPASEDARELIWGKDDWAVTFREGDRVMNLKNDYERGVYNGDTGVVARVWEKGEVNGKGAEARNPGLRVTFESIDYTGETVVVEADFDKGELTQLTHSWVITVHKSQGAEADHVVIPLHTSHSIMLQRNLLYTAITRAKKCCWLIGEEKCIAQAARNVGAMRRNTLLKEVLAA